MEKDVRYWVDLSSYDLRTAGAMLKTGSYVYITELSSPHEGDHDMAAKRTRIDGALRRAVARLRQEIDVETAVLFGSRVTGTAHCDSDFDLAVFSKAVERWTVEDKVRLAGMIKEISPLIELHLFSERAIKEARPTNFAGHILATGVKVA